MDEYEKSSTVKAVITIFVMLVGIALTVLAVFILTEEERIENAVTVDAQIIQFVPLGESGWSVLVEFELNGTIHEGNIHRPNVRGLNIGDTVTLLVNRYNPQQYAMLGGSHWEHWFLLSIGILIILGCMYSGISLFINRKRNESML